MPHTVPGFDIYANAKKKPKLVGEDGNEAKDVFFWPDSRDRQQHWRGIMELERGNSSNTGQNYHVGEGTG